MKIKDIIKKIIKSSGYKIIKEAYYDPTMNGDERFIEIYNKCKEYTMTSKERMYALYKAVEYIVDSEIEGDFVECGVWTGGSVMLIAYTLIEMGITNRKIYLYDTFEGMTEPTEEDYSTFNRESVRETWESQEKIGGWCSASLSEVKDNLSKTKYPSKNLIFIKGKVEDTLPKNVPNKIVLLRLDTDWYESTKHELIYLYPLLNKHGVLIIDDYGHFAGSKKAVDGYFLKKSILLNRIDYSGVIGVKIK